MFRPYRIRLPLIALGAAVLLGLGTAGTISYRNSIEPSGIIIHHSAIPLSDDEQPTTDANRLDEIHRRRGYGIFYWGRYYHIGYHYVILPDGTIQSGRPEHCQGAHASGYNSYIGICLVGDFSTADNPTGERGLREPTEAQLRALTYLCHQLQQRYNISTRQILRHHDVNPDTTCPGDRFPYSRLIEDLSKPD